MSYNWGPHYIVPTEVIKTYSGGVLPVRWDTTDLENGQYEVMGLMHVFVEEEEGIKGKAIARENIVEVTVEN